MSEDKKKLPDTSAGEETKLVKKNDTEVSPVNDKLKMAQEVLDNSRERLELAKLASASLQSRSEEIRNELKTLHAKANNLGNRLQSLQSDFYPNKRLINELNRELMNLTSIHGGRIDSLNMLLGHHQGKVLESNVELKKAEKWVTDCENKLNNVIDELKGVNASSQQQVCPPMTVAPGTMSKPNQHSIEQSMIEGGASSNKLSEDPTGQNVVTSHRSLGRN